MANPSLFTGSGYSARYAKFRPIPPPIVLDKIMTYVKEKFPSKLGKAVDVGCGTGQSTQALQPYFQEVMGFDVSETQIHEAKEQAQNIPNITFAVSKAEAIPIADDSVQLVTVSQAAHWIDMPAFYKEVKRILMPHGSLAVFCYLVPQLVSDKQEKTTAIQGIIEKFYSTTMKEFWDSRRYLIDNKYRDIQFPEEIFTDCVRTEDLIERKPIVFDDYIGYLKTWSSFQTLKRQDPDRAEKEINHFAECIAEIMGNKSQDPSKLSFLMELPYVLLLGRKN